MLILSILSIIRVLANSIQQQVKTKSIDLLNVKSNLDDKRLEDKGSPEVGSIPLNPGDILKGSSLYGFSALGEPSKKESGYHILRSLSTEGRTYLAEDLDRSNQRCLYECYSPTPKYSYP